MVPGFSFLWDGCSQEWMRQIDTDGSSWTVDELYKFLFLWQRYRRIRWNIVRFIQTVSEYGPDPLWFSQPLNLHNFYNRENKILVCSSSSSKIGLCVIWLILFYDHLMKRDKIKFCWLKSLCLLSRTHSVKHIILSFQ